MSTKSSMRSCVWRKVERLTRMRIPISMPYPMRSQASWQKLRSFMKLDSFRIPASFANASLTTRFALYSFVCVSIMTAALWLIVSIYLINQITGNDQPKGSGHDTDANEAVEGKSGRETGVCETRWNPKAIELHEASEFLP